MFTHMHLYMHSCIHEFTCAYKDTHTWECVYICRYIRIIIDYMYISMYTNACIDHILVVTSTISHP